MLRFLIHFKPHSLVFYGSLEPGMDPLLNPQACLAPGSRLTEETSTGPVLCLNFMLGTACLFA